MDKVLNFLIGFLSFMIVVALALVIVFSFIGYDVSIKLNGATSVAKEEMKCKMTLLGCYIVTPEATRENGNVLGYSFEANDHEALVKVGDRIKIEEETDLYVISSRTYKVHIEKDGVDYLEKTDVSCDVYNTDTSCKTKLPEFNKVGYQNAGYSKSTNVAVTTPSEYFPYVESSISEDLVLHPRYTEVRDDGIKKVYSTGNVYSINGTYIEFEEGVSQTVIDKYKGFLEEIKNKAPYLFVGEKINILQMNTFQKVWNQYASPGSVILGICYGSSILGYPLSRTIDVFYYSGNSDVENYRTLVHEMSHAFDMYYGYATNGKVPDIYDENTVLKQGGSLDTMLNKIYGTSRISAQSDILSYFNSYKNMRTNRPIDHQGYAYTKNLEFVAEAFSWYYMQFVLKDKSYVNTPFPDDFKNTLEKYICVANNGYDKSKC